ARLYVSVPLTTKVTAINDEAVPYPGQYLPSRMDRANVRKSLRKSSSLTENPTCNLNLSPTSQLIAY
ncbi:hypothetical protein HK102_011860, partial [Quaeritorhiza haematococci]